MAKHTCPNAYHGEGARGGCFFQATPGRKPETVQLDVGWSCVIVSRAEIPVTWLTEIIAIATDHPGGMAGFLAEHKYGGGEGSYALSCDPPGTFPARQFTMIGRRTDG